MGEKFYNIFVFAEVLMEHKFHLELFWAEFSMLEGVGFVYEFDRYDGFWGVYGNGFADTTIDFVLVVYLRM